MDFPAKLFKFKKATPRTLFVTWGSLGIVILLFVNIITFAVIYAKEAEPTPLYNTVIVISSISPVLALAVFAAVKVPENL